MKDLVFSELRRFRWLALLLGTEFFTTRVVDLRHYLMLVHVLAFALSRISVPPPATV
jgi:hypothetical protein